MQLTGAQIIIKLLEQQGVTTVAGIPGGGNLPIYDALCDSRIRHILARHEQGAGFIAQGMARSTGKAAVCFGTSGPGTTNLLTAIADAKSDSVPLVAITGQVPLSLIGTDAFQEVDTYGLTLPITKHNILVKSPLELLEVIPEAFTIAESHRPGPVVIDIPKDIQTETITVNQWPDKGGAAASECIAPEDIKKILMMIDAAERPVLYIGGGIVASDASGLLTAFARKNAIPVTSTLMGLGCFPPEDPLFLGMLGMHGARHTNFIMEEADLILAFGVRFDDRATGKINEFCRNAAIVHIDIDKSEIDKLKTSHFALNMDIGSALQMLLPEVRPDNRTAWHRRITQLTTRYPREWPDSGDDLHPINIMTCIHQAAPRDTIITTDVGQHQMWVAQAYPFHMPRTLLTSGGLGTMGFGMPAAIGAALANPDKKVVCISGDGSFLMNIQELATLAEHQLDVAVVIMNNNHLGLVRQQQALFFNNRFSASKFNCSPDFAAIARGFGIWSYKIENAGNPHEIIRKALRSKGPVVLDIAINNETNVFPMVPPGAANREMIGGETHA